MNTLSNCKKWHGTVKMKLLFSLKVASIAIFLLTVCNGTMYATKAPEPQQQDIKTVSGVVVDKNNEPLIGVVVKVVGSKTEATVTDVDGKYKIGISSKSPSLSFSYMGFTPITKKVTGETMNISLLEDTQNLNEVVVVGYGTMKKANLTGAVTSVDVNKTLSSRPIADVGRGLQGVVPGLSVTLPTSEIGSDPTMKIRGNILSLNGSAHPLILLDNVEIPSIQLVNPDDIESISVLKDAAASSIYGAKAAAGVILITSKKGASDRKLSIQYSNNFAWQSVAKDIEMADIDGMKYALNAMQNAQGENRVGAFFWISEESIARAEEWKAKYGGKLGINDPVVYGRDWYRSPDGYRMGVRLYNSADYMIKDSAPMQNHNLSIGGTVDKTTYNIAMAYLNQESLLKPVKKDDFRRYNVSLRLNTELSKNISVRAGALYSDRNKRSPYTGSYANDPWYYAYRWGPIMPWGVDEYGDSFRSPAYEMSVANTAQLQNKYTSVNLGTTINLSSQWDVMADYTYATNNQNTTRPGRKFKAKDLYSWSLIPRVDGFGNVVYVDRDGNTTDAFDPEGMRAYDHPVSEYFYTNSDIYGRGSSTSNSGTLNVYSTYNLNLGKNEDHVVKFMLGINRVDNNSDYSWASITEVFDWENPQMAQALGTQSASGSSAWESQMGYFARFNYIYKNKYLLEANLRYDGSSKFPEKDRWQWFPSFSAGWILSEEAFMKDINKVLSYSKIRGSYGSIGDQTVASGLYLPLMAKRELQWITDSGKKALTFNSPNLINQNLLWQKIQTIDIGADFRFWDNKIGLTVDWYQRRTKDMITTGPVIPKVVGAVSPKSNYAELTTKGWEIAVDFNHTFGNGLNLYGNVAFYDSKSVFTDAFDKSERSIWSNYVGKQYGEIWGYKTDRLYQYDDFVLDSNGKPMLHTINDPGSKYHGRQTHQLKGDNAVYQPNLEGGNFYFSPGDVKLKDLNGDGYIDAGQQTIDDSGDMTVIGNNAPRYEYSIKLGASYKGFDASVYSQGVGKRDYLRSGPLAVPGFAVGDGAMPQSIAGDYWTPENPNAFYARPWTNGGSNTIQQSRYLLNMSYFRIKNITFGYTCSASWLRKAFMQKARIYVSLENFFTFDHLDGLPIDPETVPGISVFSSDNNYNSSRMGVGVPTFKTVSFGVQLNF